MRLARLIVKDTAGIVDVDLSLRDGDGRALNRAVIFGASGSGKTRLLQILAALYKLPMSIGRPDGLKEVGYAAAWVDLDAVLYPPHLKPSDSHMAVVACGDRGHHVAPAGEDGVEETAAMWVTAQGDVRSDIPMRSRVRSVSAATSKIRQGQSDRRGGLLVYPQYRDLGNLKLDGIKQEETPYEWVFEYRTRNTWTGSLEAWLVWQNYLDLEDLKEGREAHRFGDVVELINGTLPRCRIAGVYQGRVRVCPADDPDRTFLMDQMSSGERQVVLLLADAARRLCPGSLMAVDAPELHLDGSGQTRLMDALDGLRADRSAQLLVLTASDHIRDWFPPEERFDLA